MNLPSNAPEASSRVAVDGRPAFGLLHVDDDLLVVVKPAGLPCVPARAAHLHDCLSGRVQAVFADALVVHRLDMATSGLVLMARGKEAQRKLGNAFADRAVRKRYVAVVAGRLVVGDDSGAPFEIDLPLMADWPNRPKQKVDLEHGKPSLTRATIAGYDEAGDTTRLLLEPVTGRTHQLRVHLQAIGHPIVGDTLYGPPGSAGAARLLLYASELSFAHPTTGHSLRFSSTPDF